MLNARGGTQRGLEIGTVLKSLDCCYLLRPYPKRTAHGPRRPGWSGLPNSEVGAGLCLERSRNARNPEAYQSDQGLEGSFFYSFSGLTKEFMRSWVATSRKVSLW